jgi:predicted transcriptional regulator of viral defense system
MNKSRIQIARNDIVQHFDAAPSKFFSHRELAAVLAKERSFWRLADATNTGEFVAFLKKQKLSEYRFKFPHREEAVYVWGNAPLLQLLAHIHNQPIFSHYSAAKIHGLTEQTPTAIYMNLGRTRSGIPPSGGHAPLQQENVDKAFARPPRITTNVAEVGRRRIYMLNTTERHQDIGVIKQEVQDEEVRFIARVTNLERTLIDLAVRPFYSGGVGEVLKAYRNARSNVSINKLVSMLTDLDYVYPYHQSIGFYLERSGYRANQIDLLKKKPITCDFYLDYEMINPDYVADWRLHVPKGL